MTSIFDQPSDTISSKTPSLKRPSSSSRVLTSDEVLEKKRKHQPRRIRNKKRGKRKKYDYKERRTKMKQKEEETKAKEAQKLEKKKEKDTRLAQKPKITKP